MPVDVCWPDEYGNQACQVFVGCLASALTDTEQSPSPPILLAVACSQASYARVYDLPRHPAGLHVPLNMRLCLQEWRSFALNALLSWGLADTAKMATFLEGPHAVPELIAAFQERITTIPAQEQPRLLTRLHRLMSASRRMTVSPACYCCCVRHTATEIYGLKACAAPGCCRADMHSRSSVASIIVLLSRVSAQFNCCTCTLIASLGLGTSTPRANLHAKGLHV